MAWIVHNCDCLDFLRTLPDGSVDAVVTDPPYGLDYPYATYKDTQANLVTLIDGVLPECLRVAKRTVIFPGLTNLWIYPKPTWVLSWSWNDTSHYGFAGITQWQPILLYGKDISGFGSVNGVLKSDRIHFADGNGIGFLADYKGKDHPCPKPEKLMRFLTLRFSMDGETILDPFCGSGTTGVACIQTGRNFIGCEIDAGYAEIARRRCRDAEEDYALFKGTEKQPDKQHDPLLFKQT